MYIDTYALQVHATNKITINQQYCNREENTRPIYEIPCVSHSLPAGQRYREFLKNTQVRE